MKKNRTPYFAHLLNITCLVGFATLLLSTGCVCVTSSGEKLSPVTSFPIVPADERPSLATRLTVFGNISKKDLEKEEQAIRHLFWSSGMFSSVVPANDAKEMRMDYTVLIEWRINEHSRPHPAILLLWLGTAFIFPATGHTDITLYAEIRDNRTEETRSIAPISQRWNTTISWLVIPLTLTGIYDMTPRVIMETMYRTLTLRVHETIAAWPKSFVPRPVTPIPDKEYTIIREAP